MYLIVSWWIGGKIRNIKVVPEVKEESDLRSARNQAQKIKNGLGQASRVVIAKIIKEIKTKRR